MSVVNVQVSQAYNRTEVTRERISLIFKLREICLSYRLSLVSLVLLLYVQFWTVLQAWTLICDDCAQILEAVNVVQLFTVDSFVNTGSICVVGHQFGLLCTTFLAKGRRGLIKAIHQGG